MASITSRRPEAAFVVAVALVALNMRTVFASLPPLLDDVRDDVGLSAAVAGLLTTGPVLCFGLFAPVLRGAGAHAVASLTAMALSVGYLIAAAGPLLLGLAHDVVGGWTVVLAGLIAITLAELPAGALATRPWTTGVEEL